MSTLPFLPTGPTVLVAAATTAPDGVQAGTAASEFRLQNNGNSTAFIAIGATAALAKANAVVPTAGSAKSCFPLPPGAIEILTFEPGSFFSAITESGSSDVYVTPGRGV